MFLNAKTLLFVVTFLSIVLLNGCGKQSSKSVLEYVPADTVVYFGSQEPFPLKESMQWSNKTFSRSASFYENINIKASENDSPGARFLNHLFKEYTRLLQNADLLDAEWGLEINNQMAFYTLGLAPVLRLELSDVALFEKKIASIESAAGVRGEKKTLGEASYWRYLLSDEANTRYWVIIGLDKEDAVFTFDLGIDSEKNLVIALGQEKPEKSLATSRQVEQIQEKYSFKSKVLIGFINQRELINGLTSTDANSIAKMISFLEQQAKSTESDLTALRTQGCRADMMAIADNWPRTVFGYNEFDLNSDPARMSMLMITEIKDTKLLEGLQSISGFIPQFVMDESSKIFSFGLGLDVDRLEPFLTQQLAEIQQKDYQCDFLKEMKHNLSKTNPGALAVVTAMIQGIKGASVTLNDVETGKMTQQGMPEVKKLDAIVTLSADDIIKLLQMVKAMNPMLAQMQIPEDGSVFEIPLPLPISGNEKLMGFAKKSQMAVYIGQTASQQAQAFASMPLTANQSFFKMQLDYGKYFGALLNSIPAGIAQTPEMMEMYSMLKEINMSVNGMMKFSEDGIVFESEVITPQKKST